MLYDARKTADWHRAVIYKDENFPELLYDIQELGMQDFTNAIPTAVAPRRGHDQQRGPRVVRLHTNDSSTKYLNALRYPMKCVQMDICLRDTMSEHGALPSAL